MCNIEFNSFVFIPNSSQFNSIRNTLHSKRSIARLLTYVRPANRTVGDEERGIQKTRKTVSDKATNFQWKPESTFLKE